MSAGCVHQKASVILAGGFLLGSLALGNGIEYATGALMGIMLTPDLDVDRGYIGNSILKKRVGSWAERGWSLLWYFYRRSIKHGSELSHLPILSTIVRLAYLYLFLVVLPYTVLEMALPGAWSMGSELHWWITLILYRYKLILGLIASDTIHYALDVLTTEHSKQKKIEIFGMPLASSSCK